MKKILTLLLLLCFAFTGCNQTIDSKSKSVTNATSAIPPSNTTNTDNGIVETTAVKKITPATPKIAATPATVTKPSTSSNDGIIKDLFDKKQSDVQVHGNGVIVKILPDDNDGTKHQRFILKLNSGQTLLITHNIDIAPRLDGLAVGEKVEFYGEYYYNSEGGGIHWTHSDLNGKHISGYLKRNGNAQTKTTTQNTDKSNISNQNYIGNRNSQVLHVPTCDSLPYERNRIYFGTIQEALNKGYRKHYECMGN
jgi:predicted small secreted protein